MTNIIELQTTRLKLRQWQPSDYSHFAVMNADPEQMQFYPWLLTTDESNALADRFRSLITQQGWGFWAVEHIEDGKFIGFVGLHRPTYELAFTPCVEIGWRIAKQYWRNGYATEAASAVLRAAFECVGLMEVLAFTAVINHKSQAVMRRLHVINTQQNFEHPLVPENHPLREHVLYRMDKLQWMKLNIQAIPS